MKLHQKLHGINIVRPQQLALANVRLRQCLELSQFSPGRFRCQLCDKTFKFYTLYTKHFMQNHRVHYGCERTKCNRSFRTKVQLSLHQANGHRMKNKQFKVVLRNVNLKTCGQCHKSYVFRKNLTQHRAKVHKRIARPRNG